MNNLTDRFTKAVDYARIAHAAQMRKGTTIPYLTHLLGVATLVIRATAEAEKAQAIAAIADKYEQDKRESDEAQKRLVADLRAGAVKLQNRWRGCVSDVAATAAERDAAAADRDASAARVVRAARDADDQIRALQEIVKADRK